MKSKKYLFLDIFILVSALAGIISLVLSLFISGNAQVLTLLTGLVSFLILVSLLIIYITSQNADKKKAKEDIIKGLKQYQNSQRVIIKTDDMDDAFVDIANEVSALSIKGQGLRNKFIYKKENFLDLVSESVDVRNINNLAIVVVNKDIDVQPLIKQFKNVLINKHMSQTTLVVIDYSSRNTLEKIILATANSYKDAKFSLFYYPDYSLKEVEKNNKLSPSSSNKNVDIYSRSLKNYESYYALISSFTSDYDKDKYDVTSFILQAMRYLPFTNIAVNFNHKVKYFKWSDQQDFDQVEKDNYGYYEEKELYHKGNNVISVILASQKPLNVITKEEELVIDSFLNALLTILLPEFLESINDNLENRINDLLVENRSYSYVIDKKYKIVSASDYLRNKYKKEIVGQYCYKALFNRTTMCKNCPLKESGAVTKLVPSLGSDAYTFTSVNRWDNKQILIMEQRHDIFDRQSLNEILLDSINNDKRGYVMVFKIDYLDDLSKKHGVDKETFVKQFIDILKAYSLDGHLYQKEEDEFAYVLENARYLDAVEIARKVSFAFEDRLDMTNNGVLLTPKIILLSYPLEINSLFALDSLSRTLFKSADKRGKLYRLSIDPVYINRKREYLEILEQSLKNENIPMEYVNYKDNNSRITISKVNYAYFDNNNNPIREDMMTLYAKLDGLYGALIERTFKYLPYEKNVEYVVYMAKEALNPSLFASIHSELAALKISPSRIIIASDELYFKDHPQLLKKYSDLGYQFALGNIEVGSTYSLPIKVKYARIDKYNYLHNKRYALKVLALSKLGIDMLCDEKIEGLESRYNKL